MVEVVNLLRAAAIPETDVPDPQKHIPRRKRQAFDRESFEAGKDEGKLEMLEQMQSYKRRQMGIEPPGSHFIH
jgi:hypothetical protein